MPSAIIMAGGRSLRMRSSLGNQHKALVEVLGVPMLERNLLALLSHGFREIFLAVNAEEESLLAFARSRAVQLARACRAKLKLIVETRPLGTIGAAREVRTTHDLLVVNVDNLTALDLTAFLKHHRSARASMTIATHTEPFKVPFGRVSVRNGRVIAYHEKPVLPVILSSGTYVLSKDARLRIPQGQAVGAPELVQILLREGRKIAAFRHSSPWIDVNDAASVERAEELIMKCSTDFELWRASPEREVAILCVLKGGAVSVLKNGSRQRSAIEVLPMLELSKAGPSLEHAIARQTHAGLMRLKNPRILVSFDDLDSRTGKLTRYHVVIAEPVTDFQETDGTRALHWVHVDELSTLVSNSHGSSRTPTYLRRYLASQNSYSVCH